MNTSLTVSQYCPACGSDRIGPEYTIALPNNCEGAEIGVCYDCGAQLKYEKGILSVIMSKETKERTKKNVRSL